MTIKKNIKNKKQKTDLKRREFLKASALAGAAGISLGMLSKIPLVSAAGVVNKAQFKNYSESVNAIGSIGGGTQDIDLTLGNVVTGTVDTSATTFTFSNPPASGKAGSFTLILTNGGSQTVTWPVSVDWPNGSAPTLNSSGVDVLTFITTDGGTTWYGFRSTSSTGHQISQSLRFNDDDSANLDRTFSGAASSDKIWTFSAWVKRGNLGTAQQIISSDLKRERLEFITGSDKLNVRWDDGLSGLLTTQVFRDPTAWYHIVWRVDTTQATANDRLRLYVNGVQVTAFDTQTQPAQNDTPLTFNTAAQHVIGATDTPDEFFDGYMAEVAFCDGQSLGPDSFGEFDNNGVWRPKNISGLTYGNHGFRLDFANSADLGNDVSGNNNDFTPSGLASTDKINDSPTNDAANNVGNYCTMSSINKKSDLTLADGGLDVIIPSTDGGVTGTVGVSSGKWYWEVKNISTGGVFNHRFGIFRGGDARLDNTDGSFVDQIFIEQDTGDKSKYGSTLAAYGVNNASVNDVVMIALDMDNGAIWFGKNGTWMNNATQAEIEAGTTTNAAYSTGLSGEHFVPWIHGYNAVDTYRFNFGQSAFAHTIPTGFKRLCTANLSAPTIKDPSKYFQSQMFTGTGNSNSIVLTGNSTFQPDLVWIKDRDTAVEHVLTDSVRGATKELNSDSANAESTVAQGVKSFDAAGFTVGTDSNYNASSSPNVAWVWDESATAGFDIVTYTGNGANRTISHSLGAVPKMMIVKSRDGSVQSWIVFHDALGGTKYLTLDENIAPVTNSTQFNDTNPTASVFSVGTAFSTNENLKNIVAYLFAEVPGFSRFGSYTGNGAADGPFVWCGFRPALVIVKMSSSTGSWGMFDAKRDGYNVDNDALYADTTAAEITTDFLDITSNGFKIRSTDASLNTSSGTYVFAAFAENPFGGVGITQARAR